MAHNPTPEQQAIIVEACKRASGSMMVTAYAGCAKSSTIEMAALKMPAQPALALAFNVKIKKELERRMPTHFAVKTLNGLGHGAWAKVIGRNPTLDDRKVGRLVRAVAQAEEVELNEEQWTDLRNMVNKARQLGLIPTPFDARYPGLTPDDSDSWETVADACYVEKPTPLLYAFAKAALVESIKEAFKGTIDFDDQIYMSAMFGGVFPRFPLVVGDEAQDFSPLNHIMLAKSAADRIIVVGDPKQAIYAFRGADSSSMESMTKLRSDWTHLPLATTFRCPKLIVARQANHAPGFNAFHTNMAGHFAQWGSADGSESKEGWTWGKVTAIIDGMEPEVTNPSIAILCRNNAPLLSMAFKLIRRGIGVVMLGRDIGRGLVVLSRKIMPDDAMLAVDCAKAIAEWETKESALAKANGKEGKLAGIEDRAECLQAVLESHPANAGELRMALETLFARDTGKVTLSTGHRSKGLEWDLVLHLDPWRIPSKFATKAANHGDNSQLEQELNLKYVIETRTKHTLLNVNAEDFE